MNKFMLSMDSTTGNVFVLRADLLARGIGREDVLNLVGWLTALIDADEEESEEARLGALS